MAETLIWRTFCTTCQEHLEACPSGVWAEAAGKRHIKENPDHQVLIGYLINHEKETAK